MKSNDALLAVEAACRRRVIEEFGTGIPGQVTPIQVRSARQFAQSNLDRLLAQAGLFLSPIESEIMVAQILDDLFYAGPITQLLCDPEVQEILINGPQKVYVKRGGHVEASSVRFRDEDHLFRSVESLVLLTGRPLGNAPFSERELPDGTRLSVVMPPLSACGTAVTIQKPTLEEFSADDLVAIGTMTAPMAIFLKACVKARINIMVAGSRDSGRTTTLNMLSNFIPAHERVISLEKTTLLQIRQQNAVRLTRSPGAANPASNGHSLAEVQKVAGSESEGWPAGRQSSLGQVLKLLPQRLLIDEVQSDEALELLEAMHGGTDGTMFTLYGHSPVDALTRLETMALSADAQLSPLAVQRLLGRTVQLAVHLAQLRDGSRKVTRICEVVRSEGGQPVLRDLFVFDNHGIGSTGRIVGEHKATGIAPRFLAQLDAAGEPIPRYIFEHDPL